MNTRKTLQTVFSLFLFLCLSGGIALSVRAEDPVAELARGAAVFQANCATCHGSRGYPDPDSPLVRSPGVVPVNDTYRHDWRAHVYLIWDFADGGFFEGW